MATTLHLNPVGGIACQTVGNTSQTLDYLLSDSFNQGETDGSGQFWVTATAAESTGLTKHFFQRCSFVWAPGAFAFTGSQPSQESETDFGLGFVTFSVTAVGDGFRLTAQGQTGKTINWTGSVIFISAQAI